MSANSDFQHLDTQTLLAEAERLVHLIKYGSYDVGPQDRERMTANLIPALVSRLNGTSALSQRWNKAAGALYAGSEYIDEPERVFARVRETQQSLMKSFVEERRRFLDLQEAGGSQCLTT